MKSVKTDCREYAKVLPDIAQIAEKAEGVCPVDWTLKVVKAARSEACGKSVMCRDGLWQIELIIKDAVSGRGSSEDIELLKELLGVMKTSGCELAGGAAKLALESMERYPEEWDAHIRRKRCSSLICADYYTVHADPAKCAGDGACIRACAYNAISGGDGLISVVDADKCTRCGACYDVCPNGAILKAGAVKPKVPQEPVPVGSFEGASGGRRRRRGGGE